MKNSKKPNLHTCKGGVQIVFSFTVYTKGVQKVYKDEFVHQLQICSPKKDESVDLETRGSPSLRSWVYENLRILHNFCVICVNYTCYVGLKFAYFWQGVRKIF